MAPFTSKFSSDDEKSANPGKQLIMDDPILDKSELCQNPNVIIYHCSFSFFHVSYAFLDLILFKKFISDEVYSRFLCKTQNKAIPIYYFGKA